MGPSLDGVEERHGSDFPVKEWGLRTGVPGRCRGRSGKDRGGWKGGPCDRKPDTCTGTLGRKRGESRISSWSDSSPQCASGRVGGHLTIVGTLFQKQGFRRAWSGPERVVLDVNRGPPSGVVWEPYGDCPGPGSGASRRRRGAVPADPRGTSSGTRGSEGSFLVVVRDTFGPDPPVLAERTASERTRPPDTRDTGTGGSKEYRVFSERQGRLNEDDATETGNTPDLRLSSGEGCLPPPVGSGTGGTRG